MGSGESGPMDLGGAKRSRSPSAASPVAFCLLCRHGHSRSPPAGGEIPPARNETALSSPPHPSRLRRATFPPGGRLLGGSAPHPPGEGFGGSYALRALLFLQVP